MARAKAAAGDRDVMVHGAYTARRALEAGVLDEMQIHQIPVLLGAGRRLFDVLPARVELDVVRVLGQPRGHPHPVPRAPLIRSARRTLVATRSEVGQVTGNIDDSSRRRIAAELDVAAVMDPRLEVRRRVDFLADTLVATGRRALVLGISGGVDSTVAGRLCQLAVERVRRDGGEAVFVAMRLPYGVQRDEADAQLALEFIRADEVLTVDVKPASDAALAAVRDAGLRLPDAAQEDFVLGNIKARQRMIAQYAVAGAYDGLVVGTDHAAEAVTGFFTKHGDGAADLVPLAGLTKRRVRAIAGELGAPPGLVSKTPTADLETLVPGRPDEDSFGFTYAEIDDFLEGRPVDEVVASAVVERYRATDHKRRPPLAPPPHTSATGGSRYEAGE